MSSKYSNGVELLGRILIASLFLWAGVGKISHYDGTGAFMAGHGLPLVSVLEPLTILVEFGGAILVILGLFTRYVGAVWFLFLIPVTLVFHTHPDAVHSAQDQLTNLYKNLSIMGAALYLLANGAGSYSIDARRGAS
jgi:putative oxidoreductase